MMGIKSKLDKEQMQVVPINQLVPEKHLVRKLDKEIDLDFIYDLVVHYIQKKVEKVLIRLYYLN